MTKLLLAKIYLTSHIQKKSRKALYIGFSAFIDGNGRSGRLLINLELMKAGFPPINIKFTDRIAYYNAFDEYHEKHNLSAIENLFAEYQKDAPILAHFKRQ